MNETQYDGNGQPFIEDDYRKAGLESPKKGPKRRKPTNITLKKKKRK
jgi:hypothetical protein